MYDKNHESHYLEANEAFVLADESTEQQSNTSTALTDSDTSSLLDAVELLVSDTTPSPSSPLAPIANAAETKRLSYRIAARYSLQHRNSLNIFKKTGKRLDNTVAQNLAQLVLRMVQQQSVLSGLSTTLSLREFHEEQTKWIAKEIIFKLSCKNYSIIHQYVNAAVTEK